MAKKKPAPWTDDELKKLGDKLIDTKQNVYRLAESLFKKAIDDDDWQRMEKLADIFKCESCDLWQASSERSFGDICNECDDESEGDE
jgi:hypothetical protein